MSAPAPHGPVAGLQLHLRARHGGWVVVALLVLTAASWWSAEWLSTRPYFDGPRARPPVTALAPLVAAVLVSATLAGADVDLERSTARLATRWRVVHALGSAAATSLVLALAATSWPQTFGSCALVRNTCGLIGMVLLAAAVLPANLSWAPALTYSLTVYLAAPRTPAAGSAWWAWSMQPGHPDPSWLVAALLLVAGVLGYGFGGPAAVDARRG